MRADVDLKSSADNFTFAARTAVVERGMPLLALSMMQYCMCKGFYEFGIRGNDKLAKNVYYHSLAKLRQQLVDIPDDLAVIFQRALRDYLLLLTYQIPTSTSLDDAFRSVIDNGEFRKAFEDEVRFLLMQAPSILSDIADHLDLNEGDFLDVCLDIASALVTKEPYQTFLALISIEQGDARLSSLLKGLNVDQASALAHAVIDST